MRRIAIAIVGLGLAAPAGASAAITFTSTAYDAGPGHTAYHHALGDLDGVNGLDVVTQDFQTGGVSVLLNRGDGTFAPGVPYAGCGGNGGTRPAIGDFGGDASPDVAIGCPVNLRLLLGDGTGALGAPDPTSANVASALTPIEITGGGKREVAFAAFATADPYPHWLCTSYYVGDAWAPQTCEGADTEPEHPFTPMGAPIATLNWYDPDGVHRDELVTASGETSQSGLAQVAVFGRDWSTGYSSWTHSTRGVGMTGLDAILTPDVQVDGDQDIVTVGRGSGDAPGYISALLWESSQPPGTDPSGGIVPGAQPRLSPTLSWVERAAAGDFDGDGAADVAVVNAGAEGAAHHGNLDGTFAAAEPFTHQENGGAIDVAAGDLNGDGKADLVTCGSATGDCEVHLATGSAPPAGSGGQDPGGQDPGGQDPGGQDPGPQTVPLGTSGLTGLKSRYKVRKGKVVLGRAANPPTSGTVQTLRAKKPKKIVARGRTTVPAGQTATMRAKLTRAGRRLVRRRGALAVTLKIVATGPTGVPSTLTRGVRLP